MPVTVNKLDYIYKKLLDGVNSKMNDTIEISDEEYVNIYGDNDESIVDPINNKYCNLPAKLTIENNLQASVLYKCCETPGNFCSITRNSQSYIFTDTSETSELKARPIHNYEYLGLSGFIVGHANIPESGEDQTKVICYDRACPNCYKDYNIINPLVLHIDGICKCNNCERIYDLNDVGNIKEGEEGISLYRYRCNYINQSLLINNESN